MEIGNTYNQTYFLFAVLFEFNLFTIKNKLIIHKHIL